MLKIQYSLNLRENCCNYKNNQKNKGLFKIQFGSTKAINNLKA
ncbi:305_t:CDS:2 [Dentiscutata heterogama]|uniref:305_t:CDS:1 n=1 Tax=Dentiscutata heterogama TaxID=1316150 RepID=A0ACA9KAF6_9GLOM|nr:305_t:CDS:2 [Dentiscutata heterogama]